jgi:OOP family OmpA-OmpF porin
MVRFSVAGLFVTSALVMALAAPVAFSGTAAAQDAMAMKGPSGLYGSIGLGAAFPMDRDISGSGLSTEAQLDTGYAALAALGYRYGNGLRSEVELSYSRSDIDSVGSANAGGDASALAGMVNLLYDVRTGTAVTPYFGAGLGAARVSYDSVTPVGGSTLDDSDINLAYQLIGGIGYQLNSKVDLFADYRYFATTDADLRLNDGRGVDAEFRDHRVMVGLRFNFGEPAKPAATPVQAPAAQPAPPPPAPAPAPPAPAPAPAPRAEAVPATYLVFFDWDRANISADAQRVINLAAANAKKGQITRIRATGHADRSGSDRYNLGISQRRADAVKAELARQGVPAGQIAVQFKGEREPLVQTPDGVREPQNRRVEIVFE